MFATVWEARDGAAMVRAAMQFFGRRWKPLLVVLALAPLACTPFVKIAPTGDEPSYLFFADSLIRDGDTVVGSELTAQKLAGAPYFHGRPPAAGRAKAAALDADEPDAAPIGQSC